MFELKNYTFVDDYSMIRYHDISSTHIFLVTGKFLPRFLLGKKGVVLLKNDTNFKKIIGFKIARFSLSKNIIILDPERLKPKKENAVEVKFNHTTENEPNVLNIRKKSFDHIISNFRKIKSNPAQSVKNSLFRNYSKTLLRIKLKSRIIKIVS